MSTQADIIDKNDLHKLITQFYETLINDSITGFFFTDVFPINLETHIPKIVDFWDMHLFGKRNFKGNIYLAHKMINDQVHISPHHFHRWVYLFHLTINQYFSGNNADRLKRNASNIAENMTQRFLAEHSNKPSNSNMAIRNTRYETVTHQR